MTRFSTAFSRGPALVTFVTDGDGPKAISPSGERVGRGECATQD